MAMGRNQWYHFGVGAPPILVYFSGDWDVHWGYGVLTHGQMEKHGDGFLDGTPFWTAFSGSQRETAHFGDSNSYIILRHTHVLRGLPELLCATPEGARSYSCAPKLEPAHVKDPVLEREQPPESPANAAAPSPTAGLAGSESGADQHTWLSIKSLVPTSLRAKDAPL